MKFKSSAGINVSFSINKKEQFKSGEKYFSFLRMFWRPPARYHKKTPEVFAFYINTTNCHA